MTEEPNGIDQNARDQKHRQSLPVKSSTTNPVTKNRLTQSQNYGKKNRKKYKSTLPPPIPENEKIEEGIEEGEEDPPVIESRNESVRLSIISEGKERKSSKVSRQSSSASHNKENHAYDNAGYDSGKDNASSVGEFSRNNSNANSIRSNSRDPSLQSLTVIHEQYCCCSRWTPCERILGASVAILATIIIILVIVIGFLSSNKQVSEKISWMIP